MKKILLFVMTALIALSITGCRKPYDTPEYIEIEAHQTAFLIPLEGKVSDQGMFMSQEYLENAQVATKRIKIEKRWNQTGRRGWQGTWIPVQKVVLVSRLPETREWTENTVSGTSSKNEGIVAESKESISFMVRMNISAQIDEQDVAKFLYRYNSKTLAQIMDTEIRAKVESKFVEESSKRILSEIHMQKEEMILAVREEVIPYFKERGINITVIGLKGDLTYPNAEIQKSIDDRFKVSQELLSQATENERLISKAKAEVEAAKLQAEALNTTIRLRELEVKKIQAEAMLKMGENWDPKYIGGEIINMIKEE